MKKILLLAFFVFLFAGCATVKNNSLVNIDVEANVEALPITADLAVSEQRVSGEAVGLFKDRRELEREALAKALGQSPPSVDKADVLVGANVFTEHNGQDYKIVFTGYPAYYTNFRTATREDSLRLNLLAPDNKQAMSLRYGSMMMMPPPQDSTVAKAQKGRYYATAKYSILEEPYGLGLGFGYIWPNGLFLGLEFDEGFLINSGDRDGLGFGLNFGKNIGLPAGLGLSVGLSAGFWFYDEEYSYTNTYWTGMGYSSYTDYNTRDEFFFGGPFVKVRRGIGAVYPEIGYRLLFGEEMLNQLSVGVSFIF